MRSPSNSPSVSSPWLFCTSGREDWRAASCRPSGSYSSRAAISMSPRPDSTGGTSICTGTPSIWVTLPRCSRAPRHGGFPQPSREWPCWPWGSRTCSLASHSAAWRRPWRVEACGSRSAQWQGPSSCYSAASGSRTDSRSIPLSRTPVTPAYVRQARFVLADGRTGHGGAGARSEPGPRRRTPRPRGRRCAARLRRVVRGGRLRDAGDLRRALRQPGRVRGRCSRHGTRGRVGLRGVPDVWRLLVAGAPEPAVGRGGAR